MEIVLTYLTPYLIPLLALMIPIIAIAGSLITRSRREQMMHETLRQFAERGQAIPPELLNGSFGLEAKERQNAGINRNAMLYLGGINVGAGLGLLVMFMAMDPHGWLWSIGCLPLFVGVAMLLAWKYEHKQPAA